MPEVIGCLSGSPGMGRARPGGWRGRNRRCAGSRGGRHGWAM